MYIHLKAMVKDLKNLEKELMPGGRKDEPILSEEEMKKLDDFQKRKAELNVMIQGLKQVGVSHQSSLVAGRVVRQMLESAWPFRLWRVAVVLLLSACDFCVAVIVHSAVQLRASTLFVSNPHNFTAPPRHQPLSCSLQVTTHLVFFTSSDRCCLSYS